MQYSLCLCFVYEFNFHNGLLYRVRDLLDQFVLLLSIFYLFRKALIFIHVSSLVASRSPQEFLANNNIFLVNWLWGGCASWEELINSPPRCFVFFSMMEFEVLHGCNQVVGMWNFRMGGVGNFGRINSLNLSGNNLIKFIWMRLLTFINLIFM